MEKQNIFHSVNNNLKIKIMAKSKKFNLNFKYDFLKSLLVAVATAVLTTGYKLIETQGLELTSSDIKTIATTAILACLGYLMKNFTENSAGQITKKENV